MDSEIKAKWLEALRSGKYAQGSGALRNYNNAYCCLGVLCDIIEPAAWSRVAWSTHYEYEGNYARSLSPSIKWKSGISANTETLLTEMNDIDKLSFNEIANWIEASL